MEVLRTRGFEIRGPFEITTALNTASRNRVFTCYPETEQEQDACADEIIGTLATRAYRRSLSPSEMEERLAYYYAAEKDGFENGIRTAIIGILASPHFLFRTDDAVVDSRADDTSTESARAAEELAITEARPDPLVETVALLEEFCRQDADCDPKAGCDLDCGSFAVPPVESQLNQSARTD